MQPAKRAGSGRGASLASWPPSLDVQLQSDIYTTGQPPISFSKGSLASAGTGCLSVRDELPSCRLGRNNASDALGIYNTATLVNLHWKRTKSARVSAPPCQLGCPLGRRRTSTDGPLRPVGIGPRKGAVPHRLHVNLDRAPDGSVRIRLVTLHLRHCSPARRRRRWRADARSERLDARESRWSLATAPQQRWVC